MQSEHSVDSGWPPHPGPRTAEATALPNGSNSPAATGVAHGAAVHPIRPSELIVTEPAPRPVNPPDVCTCRDQAFGPAGGSGGSGTSDRCRSWRLTISTFRG